jgi:hypothetical protein
MAELRPHSFEVDSVADPDPGSRIQELVLFLPLNRGSGIGKKMIRIRDEHPGLYFRELGNNFLGKNNLNSFMDADPDPGSENLFNPGSGM